MSSRGGWRAEEHHARIYHFHPSFQAQNGREKQLWRHLPRINIHFSQDRCRAHLGRVQPNRQHKKSRTILASSGVKFTHGQKTEFWLCMDWLTAGTWKAELLVGISQWSCDTVWAGWTPPQQGWTTSSGLAVSRQRMAAACFNSISWTETIAARIDGVLIRSVRTVVLAAITASRLGWWSVGSTDNILISKHPAMFCYISLDTYKTQDSCVFSLT